MHYSISGRTEMTNFELWIKGCEENKTLIFLLEGKGENALYKLIKEIIVNNNVFYETSVFTVFIGGKQVYTSTSYLSAYHVWETRKWET